MQAVVIGADEQHEVRTVAAPEPGPGDVLVRVRASALNQADLRMAASHFAASEARTGPPVAGLELAGEVAAVGPEVTGVAVGDRVMAMGGGAWAELAVVDHRLVTPVPQRLGWTEAAASAISYLTAYDALTAAGRLEAGQTVLVQGATSAAGLASVQVARFLGAAKIIGTSGSSGKLDRLRELGCDVAVDRSVEDVAAVVARETDGRGADLVIDIVGHGAGDENVGSVAVLGRVVCLGRLAGKQVTLDIDEFARKRITMVGVTFRTRTTAERVETVAWFNEHLAPALGSGPLQPVVDRTFALDDIRAAVAYVRQTGRMGKVVLDIGIDR